MGTQVNPLYMSLIPGANPSGTNVSVPGKGNAAPPNYTSLYPQLTAGNSLSGNGNDFWNSSGSPIPASGPSGSTGTGGAPAGGGVPMTGAGSTASGSGGPSFGANTGGGPVPAGNPITSSGGLGVKNSGVNAQLYQQLQKAFGPGLGNLLAQFLQSGAGFNPKVAQALIASMQPGIERGTESLMGQFSAMGDRFSSGAQIGLGDYLSQVQLNEGEIMAQLYEQSVQNYMNVLMGATGDYQNYQKMQMMQPSGWDIAGGIAQLGLEAASIPLTGGASLPFIGAASEYPSLGGGGGGSIPLEF